MDANQITDRLLFKWHRIVALSGLMMLSGCSTMSAIGDAAEKPLEYVGLIKSSDDDAKTAADDAKAQAQAAKEAKEAHDRAAIKNVKIHLFAGSNLNSGSSGVGLALVMRVYTLRDAVAVQQAPYGMFTNADHDTPAFASDIVSTREIVLTPGQQIDTTQDIGPEVTAVAIVALFRNPSPSRWRLVFNLKDAARDGIVVGANACALTVTSGLSGSDADGRPLQLLPPDCPR